MKINLGFKPNDHKIYTTKHGDRSTTPAQKRKVKEDQNYKCAKCKKKFKEWQLQVHHKKEVHKHKGEFGINIPVHSMGKKIIPHYDRRSNLEALCIPCHNKTKKKKKSTKKNNILNLGFVN